MPMWWRMGPLTMTAGAAPIVVAQTPWALNSSVTAGLDGGDDDGEVLGLAAGHDGVDGDLLDGGGAHVRGKDGDEVLGVAGGAFEHAHDALEGGRDNGEAVGEALVEEELVEIVAGPDIDAAGAQGTALGLGGEPLGDAWLDRAGATAGAGVGVDLPAGIGGVDAGDGGELTEKILPVLAAESDEALLLVTIGAGEDEGGDGVEVVGVGGVQGAVVEHGGGEGVALDEDGVALRLLADGKDVDGLAKGLVGRLDERHGEAAGGAVLLDESEQGGATRGEGALAPVAIGERESWKLRHGASRAGVRDIVGRRPRA